MALLTVTELAKEGVAAALVAAAAGGDEFTNDGRTWIEVNNGGAGAITVTIISQVQCNFGFDHDLAISVPAVASRLIGPFTPGRFNDSNGRVQVSYSGVTSVTVRTVRLPV